MNTLLLLPLGIPQALDTPPSLELQSIGGEYEHPSHSPTFTSQWFPWPLTQNKDRNPNQGNENKEDGKNKQHKGILKTFWKKKMELKIFELILVPIFFKFIYCLLMHICHILRKSKNIGTKTILCTELKL